MGTKREHDDTELRDGSAGKRQKSYPGRKRQAKDDSGAKKRARAIERSLRRNQNMPLNVRIEMERELDAKKRASEDKAYKRKRSAMISKYHMVRFFERKKAMRLVKQLRKRIESETDPTEIEKLKHGLHIAQVDEAYTLYFPHLETYVGLYSAVAKGHQDQAQGEEADTKAAAATAALEADRPPMWAVIEKALSEGPSSLEKLRDRRSAHDTGEQDDSRPPVRPPAPVRSGEGNSQQQSSQGKSSTNPSLGGQQPELNRRERRRRMREAEAATKEDEDEGGDGGFFEEL